MAFRRQSKTSMLDSIGQKVQSGIELFGKAKAAYELGKALYTGYQTLSPYLGAAATLLAV
jgi:hypothetical protein